MAEPMKHDRLLVLINTFTVKPENADALLALLAEATEKVMRHRPGFVSATFHLSHDRTHIANYARWRSKTDLDATMSDPTAKEHMGKAGRSAERFEPILYMVAHDEQRAAPSHAKAAAVSDLNTNQNEG
jgi:quinol monooxygenase YgiN